ncbi:MAG: efflux RND transporter periplasmic adaptor subunit [Bacteroidales bacterium]|jgi:membrane fusion protein (multidrug efflux system)|nr:efflux RND transporter periplasmic adaptor subunit [Bacteroidales bacterium]
MNRLNSNSIRIIGFLLLTIIFYACGEKKQQSAPPPEITVVEVIQKNVPIYSTYVGQVYGNSDIPIRARVSGFLTGIHFTEGSRVEKGQLLYTIDPEPFQAKVATQESLLAEARTELAKAKSDLDRIQPLAEINAVSKSDLDAAQANYDAARAYVDAQQSNLRFSNINLGYCRIYSPLYGVIGKTNARVGEFVGQDPNPVILNTISTIDTVRVEFYLAEADYIRIAREYMSQNNVERAYERIPNLKLILSDGSTFKFDGYINFINREVDPQTGSLLVQTIFPNPEKLLKPGQYAKVVVKIREVKDGLLVPQRCVMELQGQHSVYVVDDANEVESRQVTAGELIGDMWLINEGLKAGENVVIDALQKVRSGLIVQPELIEFESQSNLNQ